MSQLRRRCYWHLVGEARDAAEHSTMHRTAPQQRRIWPQTSAAQKHGLHPPVFLSSRPEVNATRGLIHPLVPCAICPASVSLLPWDPASAPTLLWAAPPTWGLPNYFPKHPGEATPGTEAARDLIPRSLQLPGWGPPSPALSSSYSRTLGTFSSHPCTTVSPYNVHSPRIPYLALIFPPL